MPLVLVLLLLAPFAAPAQVFPADAGDMVPLLSRPALPRGGLVAGWDLRTPNLLRFSEQLDNAAWASAAAGTGSARVVTANHAASPDGTNTAERLQFALNGGTATSDWSGVLQTVTGLPTSTYTFSIWLRSNTESTYSVLIETTGAAGSTIANVTPAWAKFSFAATSGAIQFVRLWLRGANGTSDTADILVWGAQLNSGTTPGPYVATGDLQSVPNMVPGGAALQRGSAAGADTNDPTPSAAGWVFDGVDDYGTTSPLSFGTRDFTVIVVASHGDGRLFSTRDNSTSWGFELYRESNILSRYIGDASGDTSSPNYGAVAADTWRTTAVVVNRVTTHDAYFNGAFLGSLAAARPGTIDTTYAAVGRFGNVATQYLTGTISYVLIYNRALNPAEIKRLHERYLRPSMASVGVNLP